MASAVPAFPSTKETTNYARLCRLLVDVGCHALRERFDQIHSPAGLYTLLSNPAVHATLDSLRKKRVLNPSQWGKLYPAIRSSVTSVNFDITLLMVLLRSICGLTPPATGWDNLPPATDLTVEADIARVKFYRNTMYGHASHASVDDVTFSTCWNDITDTIVRLGGLPYRAAVNNLRYEPMDRDVEDHYKELLKLWKLDEDNINRKLEELGEKLEELKASVEEGRKAPVATVLLVNTIETIVQGGVVINIFNLPGSSQTTQAAGTFESASIVPIASEQEQVAGIEGSLPQQIQENQQDHTTELNYWNLILSLRRPLQTFCQYLKNMLNVIVRRHDTGSLLLTVECRSLQILEGLWKDYCSGHLNEMAQESLITAEVLEKLGLSEIKLKIFISEEEYERGKQIFRETKGVNPLVSMASAVPAFPSRKETTNYARLCRLLVDVGCHALRNRFDQIHSPAGLYTLLSNPAVHATLDSLRKKRVLNPSQWGKLYPVIRSSVTSVNFDITLLMVLLRSICGLTPPATGWDNLPPATDLTVEADIARVKCYRNRMYGHASHAAVDDVTFSTCWKDITDTIVRLGGLPYRAVIDNLRYEPMDRDVEDHYKELLKQWKVEEDNFEITLEEILIHLSMASAVPAFPSTKETTNYARLCRLLVDVGCHVLRERFDKIHSPAGLYTLLSNPAVHATLDSLRKKRVLNPSQWGKLYPAIRSSVTSFNFDITLLMVLLRSICGLTPPATGWDNLPPATDLTVEADIARVKCYRNRMYGHASHAAVDDVTFSTCWKDITDTIVRLGGLPYRAVVDNLRYELMDRDIEDHFKELLKQWKVDEDNIKIKLEEVGEKLELKASVDKLEGGKMPVAKMKRTYSEVFGHESSMPSISGSDSQCINAMFLCEEWMSSKGGLPTFNREFAISLAKVSNDEIKVHCYVSRSGESDREDARKNNVNLITASSIPGTSDPLDCLKLPPPELSHPDIVIGHGRKFGIPAFCIAKTTGCKWVQFVHVFCEDLGKFKQTDAENTDTIEENEKKHKSEIALCKAANAVVAVGTRLKQKYSRCLQDREVHVITPGIFEKFVSLAVQKVGQVTNDQDEFHIFVSGRGTFEDLSLKGYDFIADVVGSLGEKFKMTFVGSPEGQHRKIEEWLLKKTRISRDQVTIRGYCDQEELKTMFLEADLVALPSRTEGFGLVALEAISAGVPVLATSKSGIAKALEKVEGGHLAVVKSGNREEWLQKITQLSMQNPEERCDGAVRLREEYRKIYSWDTQCAKFKEFVQSLTDRPASAAAVGSNDSATLALGGTLKRLKQMPSFFLDSMKPMTTVPNLEAGKTADKDNSGKECQPAEIKDWNLLHSAAEGGDVSIIEMMLSLGFDVNSKDSLGTTPLMVAAAKGKKQAVDFLLTKGADPSFRTLIGRNLLHAAVEGGDVSTVKTVLSLGIPVNSIDKDGLTPLMIAVHNQKLETLEFLLSNDADPFLKNANGRSVLFISAQYSCTDVIQRLLSFGMDIDSRDDEGRTPLMYAAAFAKLQVVNYLLEKGADPTLTANNGWSLLHFACQGGDTTIIKKIISCGLDVNIKGTYGTLTPLMAAVCHNNLEAVKYLLEEGADPSLDLGSTPVSSLHFAVILPASTSHVVSIIEAILASGLSINVPCSEGQTPLMFAASVEKREVVDFLLRKGADPHLKDTFGRNALHCAAEGGDITVIEKCLSCGLDIESKNHEGKTPLMLAASHGKTEAVKFLLQRSLNNQGV